MSLIYGVICEILMLVTVFGCVREDLPAFSVYLVAFIHNLCVQTFRLSIKHGVSLINVVMETFFML